MFARSHERQRAFPHRRRDVLVRVGRGRRQRSGQLRRIGIGIGAFGIPLFAARLRRIDIDLRRRFDDNIRRCVGILNRFARLVGGRDGLVPRLILRLARGPRLVEE